MIITAPKELEKFSEEKRLWQGIPGIEVTKNGRIFVTFYSGGIKECFGNYCLLLVSDDGVSYRTVAVEYDGEDYRSYDPCLWIDPLGRLWWVWSVMPEHAVYASIIDKPDAETIKFSKPIKIGYDVMLNKPLVLSTGEWLFPIAVWADNIRSLSDVPTPHKNEAKAYVYKTVNNGKTFCRMGGAVAPDRCFDEHMVIELNDGSLKMFIRTFYGIAECYSYDGGETWTTPVDSKLGGPNSRFYIRRLKSGKLILINHHKFKGRNNLAAFLSSDDGKTWSEPLMIDERSDVSYPDAIEADDGFIYIAHDRERGAFKKTMEECLSSAREILVSRITEADIEAGKIVTEGSYLRRVINCLGEYTGEENPFEACVDYHGKEEYIKRLAALTDGDEIVNKLLKDNGRCSITISVDRRKKMDEYLEYLSSSKHNGDIVNKIVVIEKVLDILSVDDAGESEEAFSSALLDRVRDYVSENISSADVSLDELATKLNISKFYMCHLFKKKTGTTIAQYVNYRRLAHAKKLLVTTNRTVISISMEMGFLYSGYFSKWFKNLEGTNPILYREMNKGI